MGLLDGLFSQDPQSQGILALAGGLLSNRGNFGQNVGQSMQQGQQAYNTGNANLMQQQYRQAQEEWYRQRGAEQAALAQKQQAAQDRADAQAQSQGDAQNALLSALTPPDNSASPNPYDAQKAFTPDRLAVERALAQYNPQAMIPTLLGRYGIGQPQQAAVQSSAQQREIDDFLRRTPAEQKLILQFKHGDHPPAQSAMPLYGLPPGFGQPPAQGAPPSAAPAGQPLATGAPAPNGPATGEAFLATLPLAIGAQVRAIAEGRDKMPTTGTRNGLAAQQLRSLVSQYDPTYNAARMGVQSDFTKGQTSQNIRSINTAMGHLETMDTLAGALKNGDSLLLNKATNSVLTAFGKPATGNFDVAKNAVADELTRTFKGVGSSETEIAGWRNLFDSAKSPDQIHGAIKVAIDLLDSRINANQDTWHKAMGPLSKDFPVLSPKAEAAYKRLGSQPQAAPATSAPANNDGWSIVR